MTESASVRPDAARRSRRTNPSRPVAVALSLVVSLVLAACGSATTTPTAAPSSPPPSPAAPSPSATSTPTPVPPFPASLTDDEGTVVTIPSEPARIVSLTPAVTETLFALGVGDRIVGKAQDVLLYPPQAAAVPDVEKFDGNAIVVDAEKIVASKPDLVIAGGNFGTPTDAIQKLRSLGLTVLVVYAPHIDTVFSDIELLGRAVGRTTQAQAMTAHMRAVFSAVATAVASFPRPRVYYELDASSGVFYGPADQSFIAEMIGLAGGDPITTGSPDKYDITPERLISANPEVILLADAAYGVTAPDVAKRPGWTTMSAVKDGGVRPIDDTTISRPGPRLILGLALLAATIHPEATVPSPSPITPVP